MIKSIFHVLATSFALTASAFSALPAFAGPFDDMVSVKILDGWRNSDGTHMAAIEMTLDPGWKTYWRAPGDAGIPPLINWSGSRNMRAAAVIWPSPRVFDQSGMTSIGYQDRVVIPIKIAPKSGEENIQLNIEMQIGVCSDVCVPVQLSLTQELSSDITRRDPKIAAALAERPYSASEARVKNVSCTIAPTPDGISLRAEINMPSSGGQEFVVFETGNPQLWSSEAKTARNGSILVATTELMHVEGAAFALDRSAVRITVLGKTHAVDIRGCS